MGAELSIYTPFICVHAPRGMFGLVFLLTLPRFRRRATRFTPRYIMAKPPASTPLDILEAIRPADVAAPEAPPVGNIPAPPAKEVYRSSYFYGTRVSPASLFSWRVSPVNYTSLLFLEFSHGEIFWRSTRSIRDGFSKLYPIPCL